MAVVADVNFGGDFNADEFRTQIRNAMIMGLPNDVSEQPTFRWKIQREYSVKDNAGNPYNFSSTPTKVLEHDDVIVPVAIEFTTSRGIENLPIGQIENAKIVATILDIDYDLVKGANQIICGSSTYNIDFVAPSNGLFSVTVYSIHATAIDES